jgi:pSer/pThr/pTyr-binding forkhead associated (FHA) protein
MDHGPDPTKAAGLPLPPAHLRLHADPDEAPPEFVAMRLVLQPSGATIDVTRPDMLIGRHTEADIRLPLPDVSRRHCRLVFTEGCWQVIDLDSLNGVQVNGEQVLQAPLGHGDLLRVGGFTFAVDLSAGGGHVRSILETLSIPPHRKAS